VRSVHAAKFSLIGDVRTFAPQLIGILLPEFLTPFSNRLIRHFNSAIEHHFLDVSVAQREGVVEPDTVTDDFGGKTVTGVHEPEGATSAGAVQFSFSKAKLTIPREAARGIDSNYINPVEDLT